MGGIKLDPCISPRLKEKMLSFGTKISRFLPHARNSIHGSNQCGSRMSVRCMSSGGGGSRSGLGNVLMGIGAVALATSFTLVGSTGTGLVNPEKKTALYRERMKAAQEA